METVMLMTDCEIASGEDRHNLSSIIYCMLGVVVSLEPLKLQDFNG